MKTVAELLSDASLSYAPGVDKNVVVAGDIIRAGAHRYEVAEEVATDEHVETAGGVKLYVFPGNRGYNIEAFGAYGDGDPSSADAITKAISVIPPGSALFFPTGRYRSPGVWDRSDIAYFGEKMPVYNDDFSGLKNGTILEGQAIFSGDNLQIEGIGVDCGSSVMAAINDGNPSDALVVHDKDLAVLRKNVIVRNVIGLCKDTSAAYHAVLLEGLTGSDFENVRGCYGYYPIVIKAQKSKGRGFFARRAGMVGFYVKSDTYAPCRELDLSQISYEDDNLGVADTGVSIYAATYLLTKVNLDDVRVSGGKEGFKIVGTNTSTQSASDINVNNLHCYSQSLLGITTIGPISGVNINNFTVGFTTSRKLVSIDQQTLSMHISNGYCVFSGAALPDNVKIAGGASFDALTVCANNDTASLGGITYSPAAGKPLGVGKYTAVLNHNIGSSGLRNGWGTVYGDVPAVRVQNNRTHMRGRIAVPAGGWAGKEWFYQLSLPPRGNRAIVAHGYDAGGKITPVIVEINTGGQMVFPQLNTPSAFPSAISWVALDGVSFDNQQAGGE